MPVARPVTTPGRFRSTTRADRRPRINGHASHGKQGLPIGKDRGQKKAWRDANKEREQEKERQRRATPEAKASAAASRERNREQRIAYNREYKRLNAEQVKAANAEYRERLQAELRERSKQWREQHPERDAEIHAAWKRRNPDLVKAAQHRRRAKLAGAGTYTSEEWQAVKERHDFRCVMCGKPQPDVKLCVDHVIPLDAGGPNTADNLQPLCRSCNSKKHTRSWDWRFRRGDESWPRLGSICRFWAAWTRRPREGTEHA